MSSSQVCAVPGPSLWFAVTVLAVAAGVIPAVTGRYPQDVFGLVMGFNRWCYRVFACIALMRGEYPPFRPGAGGTDAGRVPAELTPPAAQPAPAAPAR